MTPCAINFNSQNLVLLEIMFAYIQAYCRHLITDV